MRRSLLSKLAIAVLFFLMLGVIALLALPQIVNALLLESLLQRLPFSDSRGAIATITMSSTSGSIELEHEEKDLLSIPKFTVGYSPSSLLNRRIETLTVEQGVFHLYRGSGAWGIPGMQIPLAAPPAKSSNLTPTLPIGIDAVLLNDCRIVLHEPGERDITIGISGEIKLSYSTVSGRSALESISGSAAFSDDVTGATTLSMLFDQHQSTAQIGIQDAQIPVLKRFLSLPLQDYEFGSLNAELDIAADGRSFDALDYRLSGRLQDAAFVYDQPVMSGRASADVLDFHISGKGSELEYDISSLVVDKPLQARVTINGTAQLGAQKLHTSGTLDTLISSADQADSFRLPTALNYRVRWTASDGLTAETEGRLRPTQTVALPAAFLGRPASIDLDEMDLTSRLHLLDGQLQSRFSLTSSPFDFNHPTLSLQGDKVELNAAVQLNQGQMSVRLDGTAAKLTLPEQKLAIDGLKFNVPLAPIITATAESDIQNGSMAIDSISLSGLTVASLSTDIRLKGTTYHADGSLKSPVVPHGRLQFTATASASPASAALSWELAPVTLSSTELAPYGVAPRGFLFEGRIAADGEIELRGSRLSGRTAASIHEGSVQSPEKGVFLKNIDCVIEFPELPRLVSRPSQHCSVSSVDISALHFSEAEIMFRLEDPPALFIEKSIVNWCDGTLDSGSLRLAMDAPVIDTVFYGSRINLGQLLEQFGFKISEGEGSLNGKLPVRISRETIDFDGGFLFSTPGTGGIVRFTDTDLLRQGIAGISEAGSVGYALQALQDFSYNWTKLTFDTISDRDELLMTLKLDGQPRTALPFKINKNGIIVESEKGAGLQYPIRLDVNVRLPLAELFKVGRSLNSIMENNQ